MIQRERGIQSILDTGGIQAERVADFWWFAFTIAAVVFVLVIAAAAYATFHRRREALDEPAKQRRMTRWIAGSVGTTAVVLLVYFVVDLRLGRAEAALGEGDPEMLTIEVTGHQWWWEVKYSDREPSRRVTTANEIHVPVGRPVRLKMTSGDVIHSFWVPSLSGKRDLIPRHLSEITFRADREGIYRGQCAEFCGHQHAKMGLLVIAQSPSEFQSWYARQLLPAEHPRDSVQTRGQEVFLSAACVMCHTIRGTAAGGRVGPELTHLASRRTLASAAIPNTRGHLAGWIADPQRIKPGTRMPPNPLKSEDLQALLAYLETLR